MTRKVLDSMSPEAKRFYSRIINTSVLNIHAVRRGYFDTLICESNDLGILSKWHAAVPYVVEMIRLDNMSK